MSEPNSNLEDQDAQEALIFYDGGAYNAPDAPKLADGVPDKDQNGGAD